MAAYRQIMTHVTCRLTAKNLDQLRNPTLSNRVWSTFAFFNEVATFICLPIIVIVILYLYLGRDHQHPGGERYSASARLTQCCSSRCRNCPQHPQDWRHRQYSHLLFTVCLLSSCIHDLECFENILTSVLSWLSVLWLCWLGGRKGIRPVRDWVVGVLAWLSVWSEVQTCIWPSWCHCHSLSVASVPAHPSSPGQTLKVCGCVCVFYLEQFHWYK